MHLKQCKSDYNDGSFHSFQCGLIYRIYRNKIFIASRSGTLIVQFITDENGVNIVNELRVGQRFATPPHYLEDALTFSAEYSSEGIIENN